MDRVLPQDSLEEPPTYDQYVVETLRRTVPTHRSANALAFGDWTGVRMTWTPSVRNTSSNGPENLASRSRIRNRLSPTRSPTARSRACCVTHPESGLPVTPSTCTRRDPTSIANST